MSLKVISLSSLFVDFGDDSGSKSAYQRLKSTGN